MPGRRCAVGGCNNSRVVTRTEDASIVYHNFPKGRDSASKTNSKKWISCCKRTDKVNPLTAVICSIHFNQNDYERDLQNELLGLPLRKTLKKSAVPSLNLPGKNKVVDKISDREKRHIKKEQKELVRTILQDANSQQASSLEQTTSDLVKKYQDKIESLNAQKMPGAACAVVSCTNTANKTKNRIPIVSYHSFPQNEKLRNVWVKFCRRETTLNPQTSFICSEHFELQDFKTHLVQDSKLRRRLHPTAYPKIITNDDKNKSQNINKDSNILEVEPDIIESDQMIPETSQEDESLQLKYSILMGKHEELKKKYSTMLALNRSLKQKIRKLARQASNANEKLNIVQSRTDPFQKVLNSVFSKTQIGILTKAKKKIIWSSADIAKALSLLYLSRPCYTFLSSQLMYPLPHVSILAKWASKINLRQGLLKGVLQLMSVAALNMERPERVCVVQFDQTEVTPLYEYDERNDTVVGPHDRMQVIMVRGLFSNWQQPVSIEFDKETTPETLMTVIAALHDISFEVVACVSRSVDLWREMIVSVDETSFRHPVTNRNVYIFVDASNMLKLLRDRFVDTGFVLADGSKVSKEPVALLGMADTDAAQLFSYETVAALCRLRGTDDAVASNTGQFIELIRDWFDIMNCYPPKTELYGLDLDTQNGVLQKTWDTVSTMRCTGTTKLQEFQEGILIATKSLQLLFDDLKSDFNVPFILTHRLNRESTDSYFAQIQDMDLPTPLEAIRRTREMILQENSGLTSTCDEEFLTSSVLSAAGIQVDEEKSSSSKFNYMEDNENDGFSCLCSWIKRKFERKYSFFGGDSENSDHSNSMWVENAVKFEVYFAKFHKSSVDRGKNVVKRLVDVIVKQVPDFPLDVIEEFVSQRTLIRIKRLNSLRNRKRKHDGEDDR